MNRADSDGSLAANGGPSTATAGFCNDNASNWAIIAPMRNGGNAFCADSTGFSGDVPVNRLSASTDFVCGS